MRVDLGVRAKKMCVCDREGYFPSRRDELDVGRTEEWVRPGGQYKHSTDKLSDAIIKIH